MSIQLTIITQVYYPDQQATSQLLSALATSLAHQETWEVAEGNSKLHQESVLKFDLESISESTSESTSTQWSVRVLCGHPSQARGKAQYVSKNEYYQGVEIKRGGLKIDAKRSLVHRALAYFSFLVWLAYSLIFKTPSSHRVLVVTNPPFAPLMVGFCHVIRSLFRSAFTYDILLHDLYPDGLIALGKLRTQSLWVRMWMFMNRSMWSRAQHIITLGRDMSRHCHEIYQIPYQQLTCITNWSPVEWKESEYRSPHETQLFTQLPPRAQHPEMLLVQYSGNMGLWHNMDELVLAAAALRDMPVHFIMIGEGRRKAPALELAESLGLENMTWLPFQPLETLSDSLQCAHLSLVSQRPEVLGIMVPSKLYGVLASGRGVIAQVPDQSEVAYTITEHHCGIALNSTDAESLARVLRELSMKPEEVKKMGLNARNAYQEYYSYERAVEAFAQLLSTPLDE